MHVVIVSEYARPWPGGISEHVHFETEGLRARGHRVSLVTGGAALRFTSNGSTSRLALDRRMFRMGQYLRSLQPDVLHVHAPLDPILPLAAVLASPVPVVGTFHASFHRSLAWSALYHQRLPWVRQAMKKLGCAIAVSDEAKRSISQYVSADFRIIPNGVAVARFAGEVKQAQVPTILFVGRPDPRKGLRYLFEAFAQPWVTQKPRLSIVGPVTAAQQDQFRAMVAPSERPLVTFHGYVAPDAMAAHLQQATLLCAPSVGAESQGIVLLEAFAAGTPVVVFDIAGYREVVRHEYNAVVAPRVDATALAQSLQRLAGDPQLRDRLSDGARATAQLFTWDGVIDRVEGCLRHVVKNTSEKKTTYQVSA